MCSQWNLMKTQTHCDSFSSVPCRLGFALLTHREVHCAPGPSCQAIILHSMSHCSYLSAWLCLQRKEVAAILPAGYVWVGMGGGVCCENMLFLTKVEGFNSLIICLCVALTVVSPRVTLLPQKSTLVLKGECLCRIHFICKIGQSQNTFNVEIFLRIDEDQNPAV